MNTLTFYLYLYDWSGMYNEFRLPIEGDLIEDSNIARITVFVVSGDEVAIVEYDNGDPIKCDADTKGTRRMDFLDYSYVLFDKNNDINYIKEFSNRNDSYDMLDSGVLQDNDAYVESALCLFK